MTSLSSIKAALKVPNATLYQLKKYNGIITDTDTLPNYPASETKNMKLSYLQGASVNFTTNSNYLKVSVFENDYAQATRLTIFYPPKSNNLDISYSSTGYMLNPTENWVFINRISSLYFQTGFIDARKLIKLILFNSAYNQSTELTNHFDNFQWLGMTGGGSWNDTISMIRCVSFNNPLEGLPTNGIIGAYFAESFVPTGYTGGIVGANLYSGGGTWYDKSGNGNDVTITGGVTLYSDLNNGKSYLRGSTLSSVTFLNNNIPSNYLIAHVARYVPGSSSKNRIFTSTTTNWLSGFWGGQTGVAYHNGWIGGTYSTTLSDWTVSSDIPSNYWATTRSGDIISNAGNGTPNPGNISINTWNGEQSDWDVAVLLVYDLDVLGSTNRQYVHNSLASRYNIFKY